MAEQAVIQLGMYCEKCKKIAMRCVSKRIDGINKLNFDMSKRTLTIEGDIDAVGVVNELRRKFCCAQLLYKGPVPKPPAPPKEKPKDSNLDRNPTEEDPDGKHTEKSKGTPPVKTPSCERAMGYKPCYSPCGNPCCAPCSCYRRPDMLCPNYGHPRPPTDVWYVLSEENPVSCTIC